MEEAKGNARYSLKRKSVSSPDLPCGVHGGSGVDNVSFIYDLKLERGIIDQINKSGSDNISKPDFILFNKSVD